MNVSHNIQLVKEVELKVIVLCFWEEVIGIYLGTEITEIFINIHLKYFNEKHVKITFPRESKEEKILSSSLNTNLIGKKIGILKTNIPSKPIIIRVFDNE